MKKSVYLLVAYDRFNYGDLLFPVIVSKVLNNISPNVECTPYALIESDLSRFGAAVRGQWLSSSSRGARPRIVSL